MSYASGTDALCYPGTAGLRNRAGLQDQERLDAFELAMFITRAKEKWPRGRFDVRHYLSLHHHLFQDVYDWAGTIRSIRIGKNGIGFCFPEHIESEMEKLFGWLADEGQFRDLAAAEFAGSAARFLSELNAIHPFREGNGRAQMSFLTLLADNAGLPFNAAALEPRRAMQAMIESFKGSLLPLERLILDIVG